MENRSRLSGQPLSVKVLITSFLVMIAIAHGVSLLQVHSRTQFDRQKTITYFRGNPNDPDSLQIPQSYGSMITIAHAHSFSQTMMIGMMGLIFALTGLGEKRKSGVILLYFFSSLLNNGSPWLVRYVSAGWVRLLEAAGGLMMTCFLFMLVVILRDLWCMKNRNRLPNPPENKPAAPGIVS